MEYKQDNVNIGDVLLPEVSYEGKKYYPLSYTYDKILFKNKQPPSKLKINGYGDYLEQFNLNYRFLGQSKQLTYCISKDGLMKLLNSSNVGGLDITQKKGMNLLLDYFDMELINENPRFLNNFDYENSNLYDEFEKDCIRETLKLNVDIKWQLCKDCEKYYPLHDNFFILNNRDNAYSTTCKNCRNIDIRHKVKHSDSFLNSIYDSYGIDTYINYRDHNTIEIYKHYIANNLKMFPRILDNKEDYTILIKYLFDNGSVNKENLKTTYLKGECRLNGLSNYFDIKNIHRLLFGNHPNEFPWHYPHYNLIRIPFNDARIVFNNYIKEHNIVIKDIYDFEYGITLRESKLRQFDNDVLEFIMEYYNNKYPAYKFRNGAVNYWKNKENRDNALKYLIEEDMKLEIEKIPLYLTITSIRNVGMTTMYTVLKNYYSGIHEWVNEIYPDVFDPKDFDINYMRNEFDSYEEQTIDDWLRGKFDNVLYNPRNSQLTIKLKGKIPDWFIFSDDGCMIVEYFGLWNKERGMYNSRTRDYIISSKDKLEKYKELKGYKFLYLYPEDLKNNFEGLNDKVKQYIA